MVFIVCLLMSQGKKDRQGNDYIMKSLSLQMCLNHSQNKSIFICQVSNITKCLLASVQIRVQDILRTDKTDIFLKALCLSYLNGFAVQAVDSGVCK